MASNASQASAGANAAPVLEAGPLALGDPASSSIAEAEPSAPTSSASNSLGTSASPSAPTQSTPAITPIPTTTSSAPSFSSASQARASTNSAQIAPQPSTASMLPRSTASLPAAAYVSAASSSSASSGSATPTNRPHTSTTSPYTVSPRRASSSLAQHPAIIQPGHLSTAAGRRVRQHIPSPASTRTAVTAASALASNDGFNAVPSMFGFYSHDGIPTATREAPSADTTLSHQANPVRPIQDGRAHFGSASQSQHHGSVWHRGLGYRTNHRHSHFVHPNSLAAYVSETAQRHARSHHHPSSSQSPSLNISSDLSLASSLPPKPQPTFEETTTISFTWTIRDLHLLREEVELSPPPSEGGRSVSAGAGKSDVWTSQPVFGDGKWKIELVRTTRPLSTDAQSSATAENAQRNAERSNSMAVDDEQVDEDAQRNKVTILSVYLTALVLDYTHANVEIPASIMVGLRPVHAAAGRTGAQNGGWIWRRFYDYTFQKEADLFTCHELPSVSEMLQDANVTRDDAVALTIQLGLGPGHSRTQSGQLEDNALPRAPFEVDGHHLVPRAILNSLQGLLDDSNTGDVRIVVRERGLLLQDTDTNATTSDDGNLGAEAGRIVPYPVGSRCPETSTDETDADGSASTENDPDRVLVRDRVLWAHSSVLKSRSDYFQTMLASEFSEGVVHNYDTDASSNAFGGHTSRNVRTLRIPDADFVTTYWFLRYLYTEDIHFADDEDVRGAVLDEDWAKGADVGHLNGDLPATTHVDWTPISQLKDYDEFDMEETESSHTGIGSSMTRAQPSSSSSDHRRDVSGSFVLHGSSVRNAGAASSATTSGSLRPRTSAGGSGGVGGNASSGGSAISAPTSPSGPSTSAGTAVGKHHSTDHASRSSNPHRTLSNASTTRPPTMPDPHNHPCADPGPASALSIFKLAHRYHMQDLSQLASLHMVATLTPQSAFPMLLATSMYTELHTRIKTYVYQHWHLVSHTLEFERCCDEVSVGMWGADAGKTMRAFVRSLVSPLRAAQS